MKLKDKQVVITGSASGIGAAMLQLAVQEGGLVTGLDLDSERGNALAHQSDAGFWRCDVSSEEDWKSVAQLLEGQRIDHLHLNAGIQSAPPEAALDEYRFSSMTLPRYRKLMGVNVDGVVLGLHYLLPLMNPGGSIVVTGSLAGVVPYTIDPLYAMTKHAITGLVRSLVTELAEKNIRINALCPGGIDTGIIPEAQRTADAIFMRPEHVAEEVLMLFLTSESGETWAKVSEEKAAWIMAPPGRKR